ncbi:MAG: chromate resistance protein [Magnetococcales bacterium]|uniref:Chromate resistance protein n=1 Tax=Candidatus Magnetobacterium casense TaxID=1455061 RepID=A0ABS6RW10_9BACT|nr:chromate resistance protein ChrB domain-containing protein [Candidatus Magnetobacterium casensis]MBF0607671.1 chromate resistance protein [Nitrospirota bacterium]MBV6340813.1 chromate resistance protein [Candidatus Magnetobacterium casensis]
MPVNNRVKIWRRLTRSGALQIKNSVYVLPFSDAHYEFLQWLLCEVTAANGDGEFVRVERFETLKDSELIDMFNSQRNRDYEAIDAKLDAIERNINGVRMLPPEKTAKKLRKLLEQTNKLFDEFEDIRKIDFFSAKGAINLKERISAVKADLTKSSSRDAQAQGSLLPRRIEDYQLKVWVTRNKPFVDRFACAWLIRRYIDHSAVFRFVDTDEIEEAAKGSVTFDVNGGDFTHVGQLCTFEVLVRVFGIKDSTLNKIAEIVHDIDIRDGKYNNPRTKGIESLLMGLSRMAKDDMDALHMAINFFEMLYIAEKHT